MYSIVPLLFFVAVLKLTDSFTLVTWKHLCYSLCAGVAVCFAALFAARLFNAAGMPFYSPLVEELLKFCVLLWLVGRNKIVFVQQALCYGAAIGAGFAFAENIIYVRAFEDMTAGTALFRGMATALMHISCPMIAATFLTSAALIRDEKQKGSAYALGLAGIVPAIGIHALFNLMLLPLWLQMILTIVVFAVLVYAITSYNERRINKWLDQSINNDIALLKSIRCGRLSETKQGEYLLTVKSQFDPEVVVDMICYVTVYLELVIEEKSRLMLREAGFETPRSPEQKAQYNAALSELRELRRRIGKTGERVLSPIVRLSRDDAALLTFKY